MLSADGLTFHSFIEKHATTIDPNLPVKRKKPHPYRERLF